MKVNDLVRMGLVEKVRSDTDRRVLYLHLTEIAARWERDYDTPFDRAVQQVERQFSPEEISAMII